MDAGGGAETAGSQQAGVNMGGWEHFQNLFV